MTENIDIKSIVTMMKLVPKQHRTNTVKIAMGKYKLPTTIKGLIKKISNG